MDFRVTITIGRDTTDRVELHAEAARLEEYFAYGPSGGAGSEPPRKLVPDILIDHAQGALIVVVDIEVDDALMAVMLAGGRIVSALMGAGLSRPTSITSVEAEPAL